MCDGYQLHRHAFTGGRFFVLTKAGHKTDFVDDIESRGDPNGIVSMSIRSIRAIDRLGLRYATTHSLARRLSDKVLLLELKAGRTAWRVAAYWAGKEDRHEAAAVLLDAFKGHSGKSSHIPERSIRALESKALMAEKVVERERRDGNM